MERTQLVLGKWLREEGKGQTEEAKAEKKANGNGFPMEEFQNMLLCVFSPFFSN